MPKYNKTIYAILGLLNHEDMTGYEIKKRIEQSLKYFWSASFGQIYPALKSLEEMAWVICQNQSGQLGPDRISYAITNEGRENLIQWLSIPAEKEQTKYEILLKLFFSGAIKPEVSIQNICDFRDRNAATLKQFNIFKDQLEPIRKVNEDHTYFYLTVLFGEKIQKAYLEWADEAIEILSQLDETQDNR